MGREKTNDRLSVRWGLPIAGVLLLVYFVATGSSLGAQSATQPSASSTEKSAQPLSTDSGSVAPIVQPAKSGTDSFRLSRDRYEKAVAFARTEYILYFVSVAWGILVLLFLLRMGIVAKLRDWPNA